MANVTKQRAGRKWTVDATGLASLEREYIVVMDGPLGGDAEATAFASVPAIGSAHPAYPGLTVQSYDVREGSDGDKRVLVVTAKYGLSVTETVGEGEAARSCQVEEWGWDDGTDERELVTAVDGTQVLNSAGDPFESAPKATCPAPVFTKVMKFATRQSGWSDCNCKVNDDEMTVGSMTCAKDTLLCTVAERRIIGDALWKYQYTVRLRYKSNKAKIKGADQLTECGWNVAVADAGMREKVSGKMRLVRTIDAETGRVCQVASSVLLNGSGAAAAAGASAYNFLFQAYERASFPGWFTSEPSLSEEGLA